MNYKNLIYLIGISMTIWACGTTKNASKYSTLSSLQEMMSGSFDSSKQAKEDSSYYNITLEMYPIWKEKGHWLYVEQAVSSAKDKPYRQRIYQIKQINNSTFVSEVYKLKDQDKFIGKYDDLNFFDQFDTSILEERVGCGVYLTYQNGNYIGSTKEKDCKSTLRGASYATSKVSVFTNRIESWDQGFDTDDKQVWGAIKAGYIFIKK